MNGSNQRQSLAPDCTRRPGWLGVESCCRWDSFQTSRYHNDTKFSDRLVWANTADPDLHCLLFCLHSPPPPPPRIPPNTLIWLKCRWKSNDICCQIGDFHIIEFYLYHMILIDQSRLTATSGSFRDICWLLFYHVLNFHIAIKILKNSRKCQCV